MYLAASVANEKDTKLQLSLFFHMIGEQGLDVYNSTKFKNEEDRYTLAVPKTKFEEYCTQRKSIRYERHKVFSRQPHKGETID